MDSEGPGRDTATVIIGQRVRSGFESEFRAWQEEINVAASQHTGFLGAEIAAPTAVQPEWVVIYRFDCVANVQAWLNSAARQDWLDKGRHFLDGPATQQVITGGSRPASQLVTVVVTHRVKPDNVDDFVAWQERMRLAESGFEGFRGSELFRPVEGVQDEWTALYRFDNATNLLAWLTSDKRKQLLDEGERFHEFSSRTIDSSFGSWFSFDEKGNEAPPPSETKTSIAVWVGLYPTIVLLTLALAPLKMPLWLGLFIGNLLSSFIMTFVTMPYYVNPLLGRWMRPPPGAQATRTNLRGIALVTGVMAFWVLVFYLVTRVFWTLP